MTDSDTIFFELRGDGDFIRIELTGLTYPKAELDWDRNWIRSKVAVEAGGFSGKFECYLMTTDFERFKQELSRIYNTLDGTALFNTLEGQVKIEIRGDGIGHFEANCSVMDFAGTGNKLVFDINFDQTVIPGMVRQLDNIIRIYPISGNLT